MVVVVSRYSSSIFNYVKVALTCSCDGADTMVNAERSNRERGVCSIDCGSCAAATAASMRIITHTYITLHIFNLGNKHI